MVDCEMVYHEIINEMVDCEMVDNMFSFYYFITYMKLVEELMVGRSNITKTDKMMKNRKMTRRSERKNKEMVEDDEMINLPSSTNNKNKKRKKREISSHHHLPSHVMVDKTISPSLLLPSHVTKSKSKMITRSYK